jgi:hypothetical protein
LESAGVKDPLMRKIRDLDKLVDDLIKGKALDKILRGLNLLPQRRSPPPPPPRSRTPVIAVAIQG